MFHVVARVGRAPFRFGPANLLAFAGGVCSVALLPRLLPAAWIVAVGFVAMWSVRYAARWAGYVVPCALAGFFWAHLQASWALDQRLPLDWEGEELWVVGVIDGLPDRRDDGWRFRFCPRHVERADETVTVRGCWRLGWYHTHEAEIAERASKRRDAALMPPALEPGERWRLKVRLKRPRGLSNPGGYDSERQALETGIAAVGHVRDDPGNRKLSAGGGIDALRARIATWIDRTLADPRMAALLRGLAVGDRRGFAEDDWLTLRHTGTSHLFAISGLHVGMIAIVVGLLAAGAVSAFPRLLRMAPRRVWMLAPALAAAAGYALLAGFEVPTQRSLAMLAALAVVIGCRRRVGIAQALCLALGIVLAVDPLAMLGAGFWLSYLGVAWLLFAGTGRGRVPWWSSMLRAQLAITLGLWPVGIAFFGAASAIAPAVNLVAIPWLTFAVVPLLLMSLPLTLISTTAGESMLRLSASILDPLMQGLDAVAGWPGAGIPWQAPGLWAIAGAMFAAAICLMPLSWRWRCLALPLALPLAMSSRSVIGFGQAELHVLDVGQGTAVLVRTQQHALLFDAGARFPNGYDLGEAVVVPALHALGTTALDMLVVSHADADHAGGAAAVVRALPVRRVRLGEPLPDVRGEPCLEGQRWQWDGVTFEMLHPPPRYPAHGNDRSCVLHIAASGGSALLTGDVGEVAELRMMHLHAPRLVSDVLLLGHHGSRTSSMAEFIMAVDPKLALATAGYRNRFGHPHRAVLRRLAHHGIPVLDTSRDGAVRILLGEDGVTWQAHRHERRRFWHDP